MSQGEAFWEHFEQESFDDALAALKQMDDASQRQVLRELHQKSCYHMMPTVLSVHRRTLKEGKAFDDFRKAWYPPTAYTNPMACSGQAFAQYFPVPARVINATNMHDPNDVLSVGLLWLRDEKDKLAMGQFMREAAERKEQSNEARRDAIQDVIVEQAGGLIGMYESQSDDNLGVPFSESRDDGE